LTAAVMPPSALALPTSEDVAAARRNIDAPKLGAILNGQRPF